MNTLFIFECTYVGASIARPYFMYIFNKILDYERIYLSYKLWYGGVAQLARAPALQAGGQEFDSPHLHQYIEKYIDKEGKLAYEEYATIKPKELNILQRETSRKAT